MITPPLVRLRRCRCGYASIRSFEGEPKRGALAQLRLDRNASAVPLHDFLADGQPDTDSAGLFSFVRLLEHFENLREVLRVNSHSVVLNRKYPALFGSGGRDMHLGDSGSSVSDGVT